MAGIKKSGRGVARLADTRRRSSSANTVPNQNESKKNPAQARVGFSCGGLPTISRGWRTVSRPKSK